jgi:hypothetical protein
MAYQFLLDLYFFDFLENAKRFGMKYFFEIFFRGGVPKSLRLEIYVLKVFITVYGHMI